MNNEASSSANPAPPGQKQDPLDKAIAFVCKKLGIKLSADKQEKYSDQARTMYEKKSGKKVSNKINVNF